MAEVDVELVLISKALKDIKGSSWPFNDELLLYIPAWS